jgi:tryptophan synthase alpha subunit
MGYANPIESMGRGEVRRCGKLAGVDGVIVVDYPPEECGRHGPVRQGRHRLHLPARADLH